ncbi:type VI secretion system baseplate subunit TssE [Parasulfitobacter algicola]|uniref:Type VI secretion system baseplate subunit TssE n=1 Tax=Parasulfitobacter algicola TaxID=2614809 RepID=A0ABX2ILI4_9RHOB|nr:type VI secretion system baseplate subunit TssE [Sulfitobacter algicola]NSX53733.1 type VI secretion system baseplate subunit TssE [Sulfitobacter algicola]
MADKMDRFRATNERMATSLLDRLIDTDPDLVKEPLMTMNEQIAQIRSALRRDLETILNTRCCPDSPPKGLPELRDSLVRFGVEDMFSMRLVTNRQRDAMAQELQNRIRLFEPRLEDLSVTVLPNKDASDRILHIRISATYKIQKGLPPIVFDTRLDPVMQRFSVLEGSRG